MTPSNTATARQNDFDIVDPHGFEVWRMGEPSGQAVTGPTDGFSRISG
jgi:hypothetical protein